MQEVNPLRIVALAATIALFASGAAAQAVGGKSLMHGKVKPGLYEHTSHTEMNGVPGVKKQQEKVTETRQACMTQEDIDRGIEFEKGCTIKKREDSASGAHVIAECRDGAHDFRITSKAGGFSTDMKSVGKNRDGSPTSLVVHSESRYLGPCNN